MRTRALPLAVLASLALVGRPEATAGQASLLLVDSDTRVRSVEYRFPGSRILDPARLREATALDGPGSLAGLRGTFDFLPLVSPPELEPFSPLVLQKDLVRLRSLYRRQGFPGADLDYEVALDTVDNVVDVTFVILEGEPIRISSLRVEGPDGREPSAWLPRDIAPEWPGRVERLRRIGRSRFGDAQASRLLTLSAGWFRGRGYPWAEATIASADTAGARVDVTLRIEPGPRARVDSILVEGNERLALNEILREIPLRPGDWYDARRLGEGQSEVFELPLVRRALASVPDDQPRDSTVTLRFRVDESLPRLISGRTGYDSETGLTVDGQWTHRAFLGARTLTVSGVAKTGWLGVDEIPNRQYGASFVVRQPYVGHRRISGSLGPFIEFTDGVQDQALTYGLDATTVYRSGLFRHFSLQYEISRRSVTSPLPLITVRERVERGRPAPGLAFLKSAFKITAAQGAFDDPQAPEKGFMVETSVAATTPGTDVDYVRLGLRSAAAFPVTPSLGLFFRASAGRLFPLGRSSFGERDRTFAGLRDVAFSVGGTRDVRGWGGDLLGPKVPDIAFGEDGAATATHYLPYGGLARATGSVEVLVPFPLFGDASRTYAFLDAGRVWSPGSRFDPTDPELNTDGWFYATGGGVQISSPAGPIRIGIGYKLNPSRIDLLPPGAVLEALSSGTPLSGLSTSSGRRWQFHFSLGRTM